MTNSKVKLKRQDISKKNCKISNKTIVLKATKINQLRKMKKEIRYLGDFNTFSSIKKLLVSIKQPKIDNATNVYKKSI